MKEGKKYNIIIVQIGSRFSLFELRCSTQLAKIDQMNGFIEERITKKRITGLNMSNLVEVRWHARGGQGAVTASKLLAMSAFAENKYVQAFPEYGSERTGAPIQAYTRLDDVDIKIHSQVTNPDVVVVLDPTLLGTIDVAAGLKDDGVVLVNTDKNPTQIKQQLGIKQQVYTVDANKISLEELGRVIPNTPMIGALVKVTCLMEVDNVIKTFRASFEKKFSPEVLEGNINAISKASQEVKSA